MIEGGAHAIGTDSGTCSSRSTRASRGSRREGRRGACRWDGEDGALSYGVEPVGPLPS